MQLLMTYLGNSINNKQGKMFMAKKKIEEKKETFDIAAALEKVNPFLVDGFKWYIKDKNIKSEKDFKKYLKEYGGY